MMHDAQGLELTTNIPLAAEKYDAALRALLEYGLNISDLVKEALAADPDFAMGLVLRGTLFMSINNKAMLPAAQKALGKAQSLAAACSSREQSHVTALGHWIDGDLEAAARCWEEILLRHPLDMLALKLVTGNYFWRGDKRNLADTPARILPAWAPDSAGYGYILGMIAFGREECGDYAEAERLGREAVERNRKDFWATHAVAHVMEMQCRTTDGIQWLAPRAQDWRGGNNFVYHLWWHLALFHLERDEVNTVLRLYDEEIRKEPSDFYLDVQNAASLLWRLELRGFSAGGRWAELAEKAAQRVDDLALPFTDLHFLMALLRDGREALVETMLRAMREYAQGREGTLAPVMARVHLPVAQALRAFAAGEFSEAAALLEPVLEQLYRAGGSHAQRDVIVQTAIEAALRGERLPLARRLLSERVGEKTENPWAWQQYGEVLGSLGETGAASEATKQAQSLRAAASV